jgi:hypothetical protein
VESKCISSVDLSKHVAQNDYLEGSSLLIGMPFKQLIKQPPQSRVRSQNHLLDLYFAYALDFNLHFAKHIWDFINFIF